MSPEPSELRARYVRAHTRLGWSLVLVFLILGVLLESMHGFKVGWYLNAGEETRRLLLTLAHAHGVLLGLVNLACASTVGTLEQVDPRAYRFASPLLVTASILMPTGFLLGGLVTYGGDPGFGVFLVAPAALLLAIAVAQLTLATFRAR